MAAQPLGGLPMERALLCRCDAVEQCVPDQRVPEPETGLGTHDHECCQRGVQHVVGLRLGQPGQCDELVGVEAGADHSDRAERLADLHRHPVEPDRAGDSNLRTARGRPRHLDDGEGQAAGDIPYLVEHMVGRVRSLGSHQRVDAGPVERAQRQRDGHVAMQQAGCDLFDRLRTRAVADDDDRSLAGYAPGEVVQQPKARLV